jgi:recombination protein RecA
VPARRRIKTNRGGGAYFPPPDDEVTFFPSGSKLLDLALGGGWAQRRVINIVGDKSTGKTLLCIEAAANFAQVHPEGRIRYRESESAFQKSYAAELGLPMERVDFGDGPVDTVEQIYDELDWRSRHAEFPELFIIDSLDALTTETEKARGMGASYGTDKAKLMSQLFRCVNSAVAEANITVMIVSQERDKIGLVFGRKSTRSGGRALDFYASQVVWLAQLKRLTKTIHGQKRVTGIRVRAKLEKNKVGTPYLEADFPILFGYGIDDKRACEEWLTSMKCKVNGDLHQLVERKWAEIEDAFKPKERKYATR